MQKKLTLCIFGIIITLGILFQLAGHKHQLYGVSASTPAPEDLTGIWDGSWQSTTENYINDESVLRTWLIPIRNQIMYSVFRLSSNETIVVGENNNLFEETYLTRETQIAPPVSEEEAHALVEKLNKIHSALLTQGKKLFVFITPSKANIYQEDIPEMYRKLAPETRVESSHSKFVKLLADSEIAYFDSVPYTLALKGTAEYPIYMKTGIHWCRAASTNVAGQLMREMEQQIDINLPEVEVSYIPVPEAIQPDRDMEQLLNIWSEQDISYYAPTVNVTDPAKDDIHILARGGSFMQTSVFTMADLGYFSCYYMENTMLVDDGQISYFSSYDELNLSAELEQADVVLLEVNEEAIGNMSFGFIDYMLENLLGEK